MKYLIAGVMLFAALLADIWMGNYGLVPCFAVYVLFYSSRSVSLVYATVAGLILGCAEDLIYCRLSSGTPLMIVLALCAGRLALLRRDETGTGRWLGVVFAGGAIGLALTLYHLFRGGAGAEWSGIGMALDLVLGVLSGILKLFLIVLLSDFLCTYLGLPGFFPPERVNGKRSVVARSRRRRVLAANVAGRGK